MRNVLTATALLALAAAAPAFAASDGTLGPTSTGSVTVTLRAPDAPPPPPVSQAQVSGLNDIQLLDSLVPALSGAGGTQWEGFDSFCIYHTSETVRLTLIPPAGGFFITNAAGTRVPLEFVVGGGTVFANQDGVPAIGTANRVSPTCATGPTASINAEALPGPNPVGTYTGTFQIRVAVE